MLILQEDGVGYWLWPDGRIIAWPLAPAESIRTATLAGASRQATVVTNSRTATLPARDRTETV